jgi:hypothetical protein
MMPSAEASIAEQTPAGQDQQPLQQQPQMTSATSSIQKVGPTSNNQDTVNSVTGNGSVFSHSNSVTVEQQNPDASKRKDDA